jgi:RNA polymerase sigma-70 factor (ECF subfamily)
MQQYSLNRILTGVRSTASPHQASFLTDAQLLERCLGGPDEAAYEALVRRHGPMVFAVCRRILANHQDAEDAFQATFLVLVQKVSSIRPASKLGNWLYGVAYRAALKVKSAAARRGKWEKQVTNLPEPAMIETGLWLDVLPLLDQELARLPEKYRLPLVLCELEGKTRSVAAQELGWPEGTVAGRLAVGRTLLARRLARLGVPVSGGVLASLMNQNAMAAVVPQKLVHATLLTYATWLATGSAPAAVAVICKGVLQAMFFRKLKSLAFVTAFVAVVTLGGGLWAMGSLGNHSPAEPMVETGGTKAPSTKQHRQEVADPRTVQAADDLAKLQGTWRKIKLETEGRPNARMPAVDLLYIFKGDKLTIKTNHDAAGRTGTIKVIPHERAIVARFTYNGEQTTEEYLYELKGGFLRLAHDYQGRPKELRTAIGSTTGIFTFEREGPPPALTLTPGPVIDCTITLPDGHGGHAMYGRQVKLVGFSPDGGALFTHTERDCRIWAAATGKPITPRIQPGFGPGTAAFRSDGKALLLAAYGCMQQYDTVTGKPSHDLANPKVFPGLPRSKDGTYGHATAAAFCPVGSLLVTGDHSSKGATVFQSVRGHSLSECPPGPRGHVRLVALAARLSDARDQEFVAAATFDPGNAKGEVRLWWAVNGEPIATLPHDSEVYALAFSPDGRRLLTVSGRVKTGGKRDEGTIHIWDTGTGKQVGGPWENLGWLEQVSFRPDGKEVLALVRGKGFPWVARRAVTWDVASGKLRHEFGQPEPGSVRAAVWSPDSKRVFTAMATSAAKGPRGLLKAWDATTGRSLCDPVEHPEVVEGLAVAPDGRTLATACWDGKVRLWTVR